MVHASALRTDVALGAGAQLRQPGLHQQLTQSVGVGGDEGGAANEGGRARESGAGRDAPVDEDVHPAGGVEAGFLQYPLVPAQEVVVPLRLALLADDEVPGGARVVRVSRRVHVGNGEDGGVVGGAGDGHVLLDGHGQHAVPAVVDVLAYDVHPSRGAGHEGGLFPVLGFEPERKLLVARPVGFAPLGEPWEIREDWNSHFL